MKPVAGARSQSFYRRRAAAERVATRTVVSPDLMLRGTSGRVY